MSIVSKAIRKILSKYISSEPIKINSNVCFKLPLKATTKAINNIITAMALQPSITFTTHFF